PALPYAYNAQLYPTLSPDGRMLLVTYWDLSEKMPDEWLKSEFMQLRNRAGVIQAFRLLVLYDLITKETTVPLKTPFVSSSPLWSPDSKAFVAVARAPVSGDLEQEDMKA